MFFVTKKEFERRMRELAESMSDEISRTLRDLRHEMHSGLSCERASVASEYRHLAARVAALEADAKLEAGVLDTIVFRRPPLFSDYDCLTRKAATEEPFSPNPPALPLKAIVKRLLEHCGMQVKHRAATSERVEIVAKPDPVFTGWDLGARDNTSLVEVAVRARGAGGSGGSGKKPAPEKKGVRRG